MISRRVENPAAGRSLPPRESTAQVAIPPPPDAPPAVMMRLGPLPFLGFLSARSLAQSPSACRQNVKPGQDRVAHLTCPGPAHIMSMPSPELGLPASQVEVARSR